MPLPKKIAAILEDLTLFSERTERIDALIELAEQYRNFPADVVPRTEANRVPGCESEVYFASSNNADGSKSFMFAVDNPHGISAMALGFILESASGAPSEEVAEIPEDLVFEIFGRELSMGKNLGLSNMVKMLKKASI